MSQGFPRSRRLARAERGQEDAARARRSRMLVGLRRSLARLVIAVVLAMSASVHAQWLNHPTRGVPRTLDGKPDLSAAAPRTAEGRPDLSGIWQLEPRPCGPEGCGDYPV